MVGEVVAYINGIVKVLGYAADLNGVAVPELDQVSEDDQATVPAIYVGGGDYKPLSMEDTVIYHRQTGPVTRTEDESDVGCGLNVTQVAPMRMVCSFDRNIFKTDNADINYKVGQNLANTMGASNVTSLATSLQVDYVTIRVTSITSRNLDVFADEFLGIEYDFPSRMGLVAIDYEIEVAGDESCFIAYGCNDEEIDIEQLLRDEYCDGMKFNNYTTVAGTDQTLTGFEGYSIDNLMVQVQGFGLVGSLSSLDAARKMITAWDSNTAVATFKAALAAGDQLSVLGKTS